MEDLRQTVPSPLLNKIDSLGNQDMAELPRPANHSPFPKIDKKATSTDLSTFLYSTTSRQLRLCPISNNNYEVIGYAEYVLQHI